MIGVGLGWIFDIEVVCYGKIILMSDVDVDGVYICMFLLMLFFWYM